jgi:hypothetical protein
MLTATWNRNLIQLRLLGWAEPLFGDIQFAETKGLEDSVTYLPSTAQNLVEKRPINAVALCESDLIALAFDCLSQHLPNVIVVKNHRVPAPITGAGKQTEFVNRVGFPAPRHGPPRDTPDKSFLQF